MGRDVLNVGVQIRKFAIITTRMCYRSVCNYPFVVGIMLMLLFLYRSSPFLFSLFVSASPVLVCTAVLLGTLLSFGEPTAVPPTEEEEKTAYEIGLSKMSSLKNTIVVGKDEFVSRDSKYTELRRELVNVSDEEPLIDSTDKLDNSETDQDDVAFSSVHSDKTSRETMFEKNLIEEAKRELENTKIEQNSGLNDQLFRLGVEVGLSHSADKVQKKEEYTSLEGPFDAQMRDHLVSSLESQKHENVEDYKSAEGSDDFQIGDQLEPSLASWKQFDGFDDWSSLAQDFQDEKFEDYKLGEGSSEAQMRDYLESSLRSWKTLGSDQDENNESDSGSDGAESSSPDASMADIIPMLDELHPLLDVEHPQVCNLSRDSSVATIESSVKSPEISIHSEDESDQKEEEAADGKSDVDDDNKEENQGRKKDSAKSAIMWTEDDQKNLMDLGTSELERNQRLESLIARRRSRKMMADNNLIDLDGMDLPFPVASISTKRHNPFVYPHESYDNLGLPPIPGSAPSIMLKRQNPFDLPYDSSEEKPDLTGDSFQEEFMELTQREAYNQREAMFRRNETFSMGSSAFDFGRPSRFRPYFVPERTDSDVMSSCSLQRQYSEISESKASSAAETESTSVAADQEEKKLNVHDFVQEVEASSEIDQASVLVQRGSQSSEDLDSLSCEEKEVKEVLNVIEVELHEASSSPAAAADTSEMGKSADNRTVYKEISAATESWLSHGEVSHSDIQSTTELVELKHNTVSSSLFEHKSLDDVNTEDLDCYLVNMEHSQVNDDLNVNIPVNCFLESASSNVKTEQVIEASNLSHAFEVENNHPKEPIYDSSPLMKNHFLSSSSDLQRETSGIDHLYRNLFVVERSNVHNEEARNIPEIANQDADDNSFIVNDMDEASTFGRTKCFSEHNQLPDDSQASVVAEDKDQLNKDFSDREFKDNLSDVKVLPNEVEQFYSQRENAEILDEMKLDANRSVDDMLFSDGREFVEDLILAQEKKKAALLEDHGFPAHSIYSCSQVESKEEVGMEMEVNQQQLHISSSNLMSHGSNGNELLFSLEETHFFLHDSDVHDPWADHAKQEPSIISRKLEEAGQLNKVDEPVNFLVFEEPEHAKMFAYQSNVTSAQEKSIAELAIKEHVQDVLVTRHAYAVDGINELSEGFVVDEQTLYEEKNDVKEMDEALLSELDAVGDFKVLDMAPNKNSVTYSTATVDSNFSAEDILEVHSSTEMTFDHETSLEDTTFVEKPEPDTEVTGNTLAETKESNLDSHTENVNTNLLVLEAQSVDDIDAGFMKVSEEVQESVVAEAVQAEYTRKEEVAFQETEVLLNNAETRGCASRNPGIVTLTNDVAFGSRESIPERIPFDHCFLEGHSFDADWRETDSIMPLPDAEIIEQSDENADSVAVGTSDVEVLKAVAETGFYIKEFELSQLERDNKNIVEAPVIEPSSGSDSEPRDHLTEGVDSMELESLQVDRDFGKTNEIPLVEASTAPALEPRDQAENVGFIEFKSSQIDGNTMEMDKAPFVKTSTAPAPEPKDQIGVTSVKFESLQKGDDIKDMDKTPLIESSTAATEPRYQTEGSGSMESESMQIDGDTDEINKTTLVEASTATGLGPRDQAKDAASMEFESLHIDKDYNEIQEPSILEANNLAVESEYGNKTLEMPVLGARIASVVESENQSERNTSGSLLLGKDIKGLQVSPLGGLSIESAFKSELLQIDREVMQTPEFLAHEGIIAPSSESEEQKGIVGSSEPLQLDTDIPKIRDSPAVEASSPALEPEEEKEVGYLESQPLQRDRGLEELQDWHVVEGRIPLMIGSKGRTEREALTESELSQTHTNNDEIYKSPALQTSIAFPVSEDQTVKVSHEESRPLLTDRSRGELEVLPAAEVKNAPVIESGNQLEWIRSAKLQQFQMNGYSKEIQDSPVLQTSYASDFGSKDQMAINSQMEVFGVQASKDPQLVSEQQPDVDVPNVIQEGTMETINHCDSIKLHYVQ